MSARGLDKRPGGEIVSSNGQKSDKVVGPIFTISAVRHSRGRESPPYSLCLADRAPHLARATVNWGCKHDSVFSSDVVTWPSALLDGKILALVCSRDSTQPRKVIQGGFFEGRLSLYPATLPWLFSVDVFLMSKLNMKPGNGHRDWQVELQSNYQSSCTTVTQAYSFTFCASCMFLCTVRVLGSAWHFSQLAYIRGSVINKRCFKAYYLCVHSWMAFTRARMPTHARVHTFNRFHLGKRKHTSGYVSPLSKNKSVAKV